MPADALVDADGVTFGDRRLASERRMRTGASGSTAMDRRASDSARPNRRLLALRTLGSRGKAAGHAGSGTRFDGRRVAPAASGSAARECRNRREATLPRRPPVRLRSAFSGCARSAIAQGSGGIWSVVGAGGAMRAARASWVVRAAGCHRRSVDREQSRQRVVPNRRRLLLTQAVEHLLSRRTVDFRRIGWRRDGRLSRSIGRLVHDRVVPAVGSIARFDA